MLKVDNLEKLASINILCKLAICKVSNSSLHIWYSIKILYPSIEQVNILILTHFKEKPKAYKIVTLFYTYVFKVLGAI